MSESLMSLDELAEAECIRLEQAYLDGGLPLMIQTLLALWKAVKR